MLVGKIIRRPWWPHLINIGFSKLIPMWIVEIIDMCDSLSCQKLRQIGRSNSWSSYVLCVISKIKKSKWFFSTKHFHYYFLKRFSNRKWSFSVPFSYINNEFPICENVMCTLNSLPYNWLISLTRDVEQWREFPLICLCHCACNACLTALECLGTYLNCFKSLNYSKK